MTASAPKLDVCPVCGHQTDADVACSRCSSSLRVELWVETPLTDERARFRVARSVASLGLPGLSFAELRRGLALADAPLAGELPRSVARAMIAHLAEHGVSVSARPCAVARRPSPGVPRARTRAFAAAAAVSAAAMVALAFAGLHAWRHRAAAPGAGVPQATTTVPGPAVPAPPVEQGQGPVRILSGAAALTTQEIALRVVDSVAEITCGGNLGTAFFVGPEHAVTNAHVVCGEGVPLRVRLKNGRDFVGRTVALDKRLDFAVVQVPGAAVRPVELGDSTALSPGDPVVFVGNPHGLDFTVHDGKVSYNGRNYLGSAYVQLNGSVNPGNSGGPLLDAGGRAVGIVSMKIIGADAIGLALPVEYLVSSLPDPPAVGDKARERWQATLERVRLEDQAEVEKYRGKYQKPALVDVSAGPRGIFATVLRRWPRGTSHLAVTFDLVDAEKTLCTAEAMIWEWQDVEKMLDKELRDSPDQPRLKWASANRTLQDVHAATVSLDFVGCQLADVPGTAVLTIRDGDESDAPLRFPRGALAEASARAGEANERARRDAQERTTERSEATWRTAFRQLHEKIAALESKRDSLRRRVQDSVPTSDANDPRRELEQVEADLARGRAALEELERRASAESVPREWRN
jgi:S1-C subfamily serine protease